MLGNRIRPVPMAALLTLLLSILLVGCYTMLKHPQIKPEESYVREGVQRARRCADCHTEMRVDLYYHDPFYRYDPFWVRQPFYAPSYYYRWRYYRSYPWWWDRYEYNYYYNYWEDPYYPKTYKDRPREEKKRGWHRRTGFGAGGGIGGTFLEPQVRSKASSGQEPSEVKKTTTQESTEREVPKLQKKTGTSSQPKARASTRSRLKARSSTSKSEESGKQEEKEQEKKKEGRSRRRKGMK